MLRWDKMFSSKTRITVGASVPFIHCLVARGCAGEVGIKHDEARCANRFHEFTIS